MYETSGFNTSAMNRLYAVPARIPAAVPRLR
jgi:hypothetical protein